MKKKQLNLRDVLGIFLAIFSGIAQDKCSITGRRGKSTSGSASTDNKSRIKNAYEIPSQIMCGIQNINCGFGVVRRITRRSGRGPSILKGVDNSSSKRRIERSDAPGGMTRSGISVTSIG